MTDKVTNTMFSGNGTDYKHDCPRPLTGCDYPVCSCDVDECELSKKEMDAVESIEEGMEERDYSEIDPEDYTKDGN